jgi:G:T/U-mismatch repair DNA glycosylase
VLLQLIAGLLEGVLSPATNVREPCEQQREDNEDREVRYVARRDVQAVERLLKK